jgi:multidrug efflux system membrane fusion protein
MRELAQNTGKKTLIAGIAVILAFSAAGAFNYSEQLNAAEEKPNAAAPKAQNVDVEVLRMQELRIWNEYSGRLQAVDFVEIKPRVRGTITEILFKEGAMVEKDQPLFVIDPRTYKAQLQQAKASVAAAKSEVSLAKAQLDRALGLVEKKVVSESEYDKAQNAHNVAIANVDMMVARLIQAELNYEYAHIRAPFAGKVSRAEITVGNVIESGVNAPVLTTVVAHDRLYAEFDVDEQTYINMARDRKNGDMPVELRLSSDQSAVYHGVVHSFDNRLNTTSGTIRARAILENTDGVLVPGMYATIKFGTATTSPILTVDEKAVGTDQAKKYVYVITPTNEVEYREVQLGRSVDGRRVVLSGLQSGEKVMVNSLQRVRPGSKVNPVDVVSEKVKAEKLISVNDQANPQHTTAS